MLQFSILFLPEKGKAEICKFPGGQEGCFLKLFHTSDWHLGRMLYGRSLIEDQTYFLEQVFLPAVTKEKPDCIILAGDLYDRQIAPPEAIRLFDATLQRLVESGCKIAMITGNHDGQDRIAILKEFLKKSGVYLSTTLADAFSPMVLEKGEEKIQLFLLPYFDPAEAREYFQDPSIRGEEMAMQRVIDAMKQLFLPGHLHFLVSHCFAAGSSTCDSESTMFVGGSGSVPTDLFSPFDYVALGHLHGPQKAGETGRYAGSPLKYSIDEEKQKKSFVMLETEQNQVSQTLVPIIPLRDVRRIRGTMEQLLKQGAEQSTEDYVEIVLEDKKPVFMAAQQLRDYYPNLLSVVNNWVVSDAGTTRNIGHQKQDETTVFTSFLSEICNLEVTEEDTALFQQILEEVTPS
jgi:exonuclease SbcD